VAWVGTEKGAYELGGQRVIGSPESPIRHLTVGRDSTLAVTSHQVWILSREGMSAIASAPAGFELNCALADESALIGGSGAALFLLNNGNLEPDDSFASAPGRDAWYTPWGDPAYVRSLATDIDGTIYVNVHVGGVVCRRATDPRWRPTLDIEADVHQVATIRDRPGWVVAATALGLAVSSDKAASWQFHDDGLHANYCRAVASLGSTVFLSASTGSGGRQSALYRFDVDSKHFDRCSNGLPKWFATNVDTFCIAIEGDDVLVGDRDGRVFRSSDGGSNWSLTASNLPPIACLIGS